MEMYTIGDRNIPYWCRNRIMQYRKTNGSTGYEYHGKGEVLQLEKDDVIFRGQNKQIFVRKKG